MKNGSYSVNSICRTRIGSRLNCRKAQHQFLKLSSSCAVETWRDLVLRFKRLGETICARKRQSLVSRANKSSPLGDKRFSHRRDSGGSVASSEGRDSINLRVLSQPTSTHAQPSSRSIHSSSIHAVCYRASGLAYISSSSGRL